MKQLERLKHIYLALKETPQTIESLQHYFLNIGITVSDRQLYRDLEDVGIFLLHADEILEKRSLEFNRKIWLINENTNAESITNYDIDTYLISRATIPAGLGTGRKRSLQKIHTLLANHLTNSKIENNSNWDGDSLINTHFYEVPYNEFFQLKLDEILWATANHRCIEIKEYQGDSVSLYTSVTFPFVFNPIKIIYHRGSFFVAGIIAATEQCLVLDTYQIKEYKLSNHTFPFKEHLLEVEGNLKNRFGITQNIDESTHQIIIEFSSITGKYVQTHIWHHSQRFEQLTNGNLRFSLTCGINRELLGWIFQWMGNAMIIQPKVLIDLYKEQLQLIKQLQEGKTLHYTNIFQPG